MQMQLGACMHATWCMHACNLVRACMQLGACMHATWCVHACNLVHACMQLGVRMHVIWHVYACNLACTCMSWCMHVTPCTLFLCIQTVIDHVVTQHTSMAVYQAPNSL